MLRLANIQEASRCLKPIIDSYAFAFCKIDGTFQRTEKNFQRNGSFQCLIDFQSYCMALGFDFQVLIISLVCSTNTSDVMITV